MEEITFSQMGLLSGIMRSIEEQGFESPTPVQAQAIPPLREGRDVLARSQTGTGKTLAFAIPAIERIDTDEPRPTVQALVLCPTRELAMQAGDEIRKLTRYMDAIKPAEIYGGASIDRQCAALRHANLVIGTPGRIMDHMRRGTLKLDNLRMLILDEADEMLDMGFREDIETILTDVPEGRQTAMFSATMPPAILSLTRRFQKDPVIIEINKNDATIKDIEQTYVEAPRAGKLAVLTALLEYHRPTRTIIFCNTKKMVDEITEGLEKRGFAAQSIHSDIKQSQRTATMYGFKHGRTCILTATDIAARGIDVSDVDFVINYDIPQNTEYYIHRIGRTGRAGKSGCSITICAGRHETVAMRRIASEIRCDIKRVALPTAQEIELSRGGELVTLLENAANSECLPLFNEVLDTLEQKGVSPRSIAQAALMLGFSEKYTALPELPAFVPELPKRLSPERSALLAKKKKRDFAVIVIDAGSDKGIWKNHIIGAITERTGLTGADIGKIEVYPERSKVEVPVESIDAAVEAMQGCKICGKTVHTQKQDVSGRYRRNGERERRGGRERR